MAEPEPAPPHIPSGPPRGWGSIGFALIVAGGAGLLFHANAGVRIMQSHLGQISIGFIAIGAVLVLVSLVRKATRNKG
jgi:succinate dehydrogenase/fumarate reductase cytochrome b subunit